jgi:putative transposase
MRHLATWLDRYSRKIVGWDVRESMPQDLVSEALRRALAVRQLAAGLIVHSDQGSQYAATNFKALVARHQAVQSMSRRGNCYDNAQAESFWSRFKTKLLDGGSFRNVAEARLEISYYLAYYNAQRRHSVLGYLAPTISKPTFKPHPNSVRPS